VLDSLEAQVQQQFSGQATLTNVRALRTAIEAVTGLAVGIATSTFGSAPLGSKSAAAAGPVQGTFDADLSGARARLASASWVDIRGCRVGGSASYMQAIKAFFETSNGQPHVSGPDWYQSFPTLGMRSLQDGQLPGLVRRPEIVAALDHWSTVTGLRAIYHWQIQFLRNVFHAELDRQARRILREARSGSGFPGLNAGLLAPSPEILFWRPDPLGPPVAPIPEFELAEPRLGGRPTATIELPSGPLPELTSTLRSWAETELDQLTRPEAELRYYLEADLLLPVRHGGQVNDPRLYVLHSHMAGAYANWLRSQWDTNTPGLPTLQAGTLTDVDPRRVAMVSERDPLEDPPADRYFSPDPRYHQHIIPA
jgi:hypothetical protein